MCRLHLQRKHHSLFFVRILSRMLRTLWIQILFTLSSVCCEGQFFSVPGHPTSHTCRIGTSKSFFGTKNFCTLQIFFKPPFMLLGSSKFHQNLLSRNLCLVPDSRSTPKWVLLSRLPTGWRIPSARKGSWATGHPSNVLPRWYCNFQWGTSSLEGQASGWYLS